MTDDLLTALERAIAPRDAIEQQLPPWPRLVRRLQLADAARLAGVGRPPLLPPSTCSSCGCKLPAGVDVCDVCTVDA